MKIVRLLLQVLDLDNGLAKVLTLEDANKAFGGVVDALGDVHLGLEGALGEPLLHLLLVLLVVDVAVAGLADEEADHLEGLGDDVEHVADAVPLVLGGVVVADHAAGGDAAALVDVVEGGLEVLAADVLKVDVDALGGDALEAVGGLLLLVVEAAVEAELLGDEVELLVAADGADDAEALVLGDLADDLADGAGGRADEDGLALLGLTDLVETGPGGQTGHAQGSEEQVQGQVVRVVDLLHGADGGLGDDVVLGNGREGDDKVASLEVGAVRLEHAGGDVVDHGAVHLKGGHVALDPGVAHAAAQVRVERGRQDLDGDTTIGGSGLGVEAAVLDHQVLAGDRVVDRGLLEDESLVLNHLEYLVCRMQSSFNGIYFLADLKCLRASLVQRKTWQVGFKMDVLDE